jgi:regulator of protease activity HflC (stomatin/prohibitin superfamily)
MQETREGLPYANKLAWLVWAIFNVLIMGIFGLVALSFNYSGIYIALILIGFSALNFRLVYKSFVIVPETYSYVVSFFGKFAMDYRAGSYFIFPWVHKLDGEVYMARKTGIIFSDRKDLTEFTDGISAYVEAQVAYAITDPVAWTYGAKDSTGLMMLHIMDKFRAYLESQDYESIKRNRKNLNLASILTNDPNDDYHDSETFLHIKDDMGITLHDIALEDIKLSDKDIAIRDEKYAAEKAEEIADVKARTKLIDAEAKKKVDVKESEARKIALQNIGLGYQEQVRALRAVMSEKEAIEYLKYHTKWDNLGDKTVIIEGDGDVGKGVKLGTGFSRGNQSNNRP